MSHKIGERVGKLTLVRPLKAGEVKRGHSWVCRCDCGAEIVVETSNLRKQTKCKECAVKEQTKHGLSNTPLYTVWEHMKRRCLTQSEKCYKDYGARGITICDEWIDFEPFMDWALASGYDPSLTLDRIDNDKGYSPENCRWADRRTQQNNRRNSIYITANGVTLPCAEWARKTGIPKNVLRARYVEMGWSGEKTVSTPVAR